MSVFLARLPPKVLPWGMYHQSFVWVVFLLVRGQAAAQCEFRRHDNRIIVTEEPADRLSSTPDRRPTMELWGVICLMIGAEVSRAAAGVIDSRGSFVPPDPLEEDARKERRRGLISSGIGTGWDWELGESERQSPPATEFQTDGECAGRGIISLL